MAHLWKRGDRYYLQFFERERTPQRKHHPLGRVSPKAASRLKSRLEDEYALGIFDPWQTKEALPLEEAIHEFLAEKAPLATTTVDSYAQVLVHLSAFVRSVQPDATTRSVSTAQVSLWVKSTKTNDVTKRSYLTRLSVFWNWLVKRGLADNNVIKDVPRRRPPLKHPQFLTREQVADLCSYIKARAGEPEMTTGDPLWLIPIIRVNVRLGLRLSELCSLRWSDVSWEQRLIYVRNRKGFSTKNREDRALPLSPAVERELRALPVDTPRVFTTTSRRAIYPRYLSRQFKKYASGMGLKGIKFHSLRHTACSWLAMSGVSIEAIRQFAGHSSTAVTQRYMHLSPNEFARAIVAAQTES